MYRLFAMSETIRLYVLGIDGWVKLDDPTPITFPDIRIARDYVSRVVLPQSPDGSIFMDGYIGKIDADGQLLSTFPILAKCEG